MKIKLALGAACALIATSPAFAATIDFENVNAPIGSDLGNFYSGVTFGPGEQIITPISIFPPASPTHALANLLGPNISFVFDNSQSSFSFFYTSEFGFTGVAENSSGQVVDTFGGVNNLNANTEVSVNDTSADIKTVILTDKGGLPDFLTMDNLSAAGVSGLARSIPDASSTLGLLALAGIALVTFRGKLVVQQ